ncbi:CubicO group peptidase, beta-lactamase class C family [Singulisphaera sp. GP187]|uniref:serine hydrolase n=1 Tax=Singulisphaera sp. GP187 TaxID=1882752 RepID=UPI00092C2AC8|nr:serine hydrolase [Singulisphaera sp. GP187]SIO60570.1 CubicO group peptidase, beta-lactamase class C family [Singulisphaera sp. GP187]
MSRIAKSAIVVTALWVGQAFVTEVEAFVDPAHVRSQLPAFEQYVIQSQARTGVPGLSIAIVAGDQVVYLEGFGVRRIGQPAAVSPDTVFQLASLSKPVGSTIVAGLVGRGAVRWDARIAALIPGFRMNLPDTTARVTVREMLSHQSGLPEYAGDVLVDVGFNRHELMTRTRFITLEAPLGTHYAYSNVGYTIGAAAAARPTGLAWEDVAKAVLYRPLKMHSTSSRYDDFIDASNRADPHVRSGSTWVPRIPPNDDEAESPAGGVSSSARDMANYLRLHLRNGRFEGRTVIAPRALEETRTPQISTGSGYYGLGWNVSTDPEGRLRLNHSGAFNSGAATVITYYPSEDVGIVVLSNSFPIGLPEALADGFFDLLYKGAIQRDYVPLFGEFYARFWQSIIDLYPTYPPPPVPAPPARPLASYVGAYTSDLYGTAEVVRMGQGLAVRLGPKRVTYPLEHYAGDLFLFRPVGENAYVPSGAHFGFAGHGTARTLLIDYYNTEGKGTLIRAGNDPLPGNIQEPLRNPTKLVKRVATQTNRLQSALGRSPLAGVWTVFKRYSYANNFVVANVFNRYLAVNLARVFAHP